MATINANKVLDEASFRPIHWILFTLMIAIISFDGYDLVVYGTMVPTLMKAWKLNPAQAGVIGSYALIGAGFGSIIFGTLADKIGRKRALIISATLFSAAMGLTGFTNSPSTFGIWRFVAGFGIGGSMPNVIAMLSEYAPKKHRAQTIASAMAGMQIGGILAAGLSMWLNPIIGWKGMMFIGAIPLLLIPAFLAFLPEAPAKLLHSNQIDELKATLRKFEPTLLMDAGTTFEVNKGAGKSSLAALFTEGRAFSTVMSWGMYFMAYYIIWGVSVWLPKLMMNRGFGFKSSVAFLITLNVGGWIGSNLGGVVADKIGAKLTTVILYLLAFVTISLLGVTHTFAGASILVFLAAVGFMGGQNVAHGYIAAYYPPPMRSTVMGVCFTAGRIGGIAGPTLLGVLMMFGLFNFLGLALPALLGAIFLLLIQDKHNFAKLQTKA